MPSIVESTQPIAGAPSVSSSKHHSTKKSTRKSSQNKPRDEANCSKVETGPAVKAAKDNANLLKKALKDKDCQKQCFTCFLSRQGRRYKEQGLYKYKVEKLLKRDGIADATEHKTPKRQQSPLEIPGLNPKGKSQGALYSTAEGEARLAAYNARSDRRHQLRHCARECNAVLSNILEEDEEEEEPQVLDTKAEMHTEAHRVKHGDSTRDRVYNQVAFYTLIPAHILGEVGCDVILELGSDGSSKYTHASKLDILHEVFDIAYDSSDSSAND